MNRVTVVLKNPRRIGDFITYARSILAALTDNPDVPRPSVSLATLEADIAELDAAHVRTLTRGVGLAAARDARLATVWGELETLRVDAQAAARTSAGEGAAIAERAGMHVKRRPSPSRLPIEVRPARVSGTVRILVKSAGDRVSYEWQYSLDGERWIDLPPTRRASTEATGLAPGSRVFARCRVLSKDGLGDFGDVASTLVL